MCALLFHLVCLLGGYYSQKERLVSFSKTFGGVGLILRSNFLQGLLRETFALSNDKDSGFEKIEEQSNFRGLKLFTIFSLKYKSLQHSFVQRLMLFTYFDYFDKSDFKNVNFTTR